MPPGRASTDAWIDEIFQAAEQTDAAIFAVPVNNTLKLVGPDRKIEKTVSRERVWEAQTPQVFRRQLLLDAYARREGFAATDDAQLVERLGHPVTVVLGSPINFKITTKEDLRLAEQASVRCRSPSWPGRCTRSPTTTSGDNRPAVAGETASGNNLKSEISISNMKSEIPKSLNP